MKYRKKPIVIEAEQWFPGKEIDGVETVAEIILGCPVQKCVINTLEGMMQVSPGDYVITGVNGEKYPCKPDIFEKTYDKV